MNYIKGFDGLRAISILFVISGHLGLYGILTENSFLKVNYFLISGSTGVLVFFSISGFLITSLLLNERANKGKINFKNFFARRFLRLLPALLVFYSSIFALMLTGHLPEDYLALAYSFFYLYNFVPFTHYTDELAHTWSLAVEEQYYLFWPLVINKLNEYRQLIVVSCFIIFACFGIKYLYGIPFGLNDEKQYLTNLTFIDRWFLPACCPIITGALASIVLFYKRPMITKLFNGRYIPLILSMLLYFFPVLTEQKTSTFNNLVMSMGVSSALLWIYCNQEQFIVNFLELKPLTFIGKISYGLYVYQGLFLRNAPGGKLFIQQSPTNIILVVVTAVLSYYLIEQNVLKLKAKFV